MQTPKTIILVKIKPAEANKTKYDQRNKNEDKYTQKWKKVTVYDKRDSNSLLPFEKEDNEETDNRHITNNDWQQNLNYFMLTVWRNSTY